MDRDRRAHILSDFAGELSVDDAVNELRFHPFNSAHFVLDRSVITSTIGCGEKVRATTTWSVLVHPDGVVVFDTGIHESAIDDVAAEWGTAAERIGVPLMQRGQEVSARLAALGLSPRDVRYV